MRYALFLFLFLTFCRPIKDTSNYAGLVVKLPDSLRMEYIMPTPEWAPQKLGLYNSKKWSKDKTEFRIKWNDGDPDIQAKTLADLKAGIQDKINVAGNTAWKFVVVTDKPDFIISFTQNNQAWSYVGTDCYYVAGRGMVTMNLGWHIRYRENQGGERFGTGCHEMLHALGYIHTLQSPACEGKLIWNKEAVYAKYARIGWDRAKVDANVFTLYPKDQISDNGCDFKSIMCYSIGQGEANVVVGRNMAFTAIDNSKIVSDYGGAPPPPPPPVVVDSSISKGKPASQSPHLSSAYPASNGNDGNPATFQCTNKAIDPWWMVDLMGQYSISRIQITNRLDCCGDRLKNFKVYVSMDTSFSPNEIVYTNITTTGQVIEMPTAKTGRYVKIHADNNPANYLHVGEFRVFGKPTTGMACDTFKIIRDSIVCR